MSRRIAIALLGLCYLLPFTAKSAPLVGTTIGTTGSWGDYPGTTRDAALDGNISTFFDSDLASSGWVGLDLGAPCVITRIRYAPRDLWAGRMVGGMFQASDTADFSSGVVTLFTVANEPPDGIYTEQIISDPTGYRYVRYYGPTNGYCNVAEIEFYGNVSAATSHGLEVTIAWNPVTEATDGRPIAVDGYRLYCGTASGEYDRTINVGTETRAPLDNLESGTDYYVAVTAIVDGQESALSREFAFSGDASADTGHTLKAAISWTPVTEATDGRSIVVDGYRLYCGTASGDYDRTIDVGTEASATIDGLEYDTDYYFAVAAVVGGQEGALSQEFAWTSPSSGTSSTVGQWDFDQNLAYAGTALSVNPASDLSGGGNTMYGDPTSGASYSVVGATPSGAGLSLDANGVQYAYLDDDQSSPIFNLNTWSPEAWTIEASVVMDELGDFETFIGKDGTIHAQSDSEFYLQKTGDPGDVRVSLSTVSGQRVDINTGYYPTVGQWFHLAVTSDGSTLSIYVNDGTGWSLKGSAALTGGSAANNALANGNGANWTFMRGWFGGMFVDQVDGRMDNVRFSACALKPEAFLCDPRHNMPEPLTGLTADALSASQISLHWPVCAGADSYCIKRANSSGGPYTTIGSAIHTNFIDTGLSTATAYYYVVNAVNTLGESAESAEAGATTLYLSLEGSAIGTTGSWGDHPATTRNAALDGNISTFFDSDLASSGWVGLDFGEPYAIAKIRYAPREGYAERMVGGVFQTSDTADFSSGVVTLFTVTNTPPDGIYTEQAISDPNGHRYVRYYGPANGYCNVAEIEFHGGSITPSNAASEEASATTQTTTPAAPTDLKAMALSISRVDLSWASSAGANSYDVKWAANSGGPYRTIDTAVTTTSYNDLRAVAGSANYYVVSAFNAYGESPDSAETNAVTPELVAYLPFDETSGTTAIDRSPNGFDGTLVNGPVWATGIYTNAVLLDGVDDYVSLPDGTMASVADFTISTWVYLRSASVWSYVFDFGSGTETNMFLTPQSVAEVVRFAITTNGIAGEEQIVGTEPLPTNTWTHVAVTRSDGTGILYVNGTAVGTNSAMTLYPLALGHTTQNYIGKSQYDNVYLDGAVDDFWIIGRALSPIEIMTLATLPAGNGPDQIFIEDISMDTGNYHGRGYTGFAIITVKDGLGSVVPNATVSVEWSGATSGTATGETDESGIVIFESSKVKKGGTYTVTVTDVTASGLTYQPSLNVETSDSVTAP